MRNSFAGVFTLVMLSLFVVSCGKPPSNVLTGVKVETQSVDNDLWLSFSANLDLGAMSFASISVPVLHPHGQTPVGHVELTSGLGGKNTIKLSANLTELADVNMGHAVLPNGNMIPLIASNPTIPIDIGNGGKIYLTLSETVTAVGVAIPISAFDQIGSKLPGLNFFPIVNVDNVVGTAGIFTGAHAGQNGIAVVADVSRIVRLGELMPVANVARIQAMEVRETIRLDYRSQSVSSSKKKKLDDMLYKLNKKKTVLRMRK